MTGTTPTPVKVFCSYSHRDGRHLERLRISLRGLRRQGLIEEWHDRKIVPGQEWEEAIDENLRVADIILLLVSPDFVNSDYAYYNEMSRALEKHRRGEAVVIPIIVRPTDWEGEPFGKLQALPIAAKPVTEWSNRDKAWLDVSRGIRRAIEELRKDSSKQSQPSAQEVALYESNPKVFISHASEDKERFVLEFATKLREKGVDAWVDTWEMLPGDNLVDKVFGAIGEAQAVIVIVSKYSINKRWVKEVLSAGVVRIINDASSLIPVVLDNIGERQMPESLRGIVWERIRNLNDYDAELDRIVRSIYGRRERPPDRPSERPFLEALRHKLLERVEAGDPLINKSEVEEIAAAHGLNDIRASRIFRSLEGQLWRGSIIKISDEPVPRDWAAVNDLEVLY